MPTVSLITIANCAILVNNAREQITMITPYNHTYLLEIYIWQQLSYGTVTNNHVKILLHPFSELIFQGIRSLYLTILYFFGQLATILRSNHCQLL